MSIYINGMKELDRKSKGDSLRYRTRWDLDHKKESEAYNLLQERINSAKHAETNQPKPINWKRRVGIAASILIAMVSLSILYLTTGQEDVKWIEVIALYGEQKEVQLPDGTLVNLNAGSTIHYPEKFNGPCRSVKLNGEATLYVVKDARHPFVVNAAGIDVKVLGTRFNISSYADDPMVIVTLVEGSVSVSKQTDNSVKEPLILQPNEQLVYKRGCGAINVTQVDAILATSWNNNQLIFENIPFEQVIKKLERRFNVTISVNEPQIKCKHYTGKFLNNESVDEILQLIMINSTFDYTITNN